MNTQSCIFSNSLNGKQDGRLARAYFSPNYNYFYQLLQTVKNETTVLNLVFKRFFTNINSTTNFYNLCERGGSTIFPWSFLSHSSNKLRGGTRQCFRKFPVSKKFMDKRVISLFSLKNFCLSVPKNFARNLSMFQKNSGIEIFHAEEGGITVL